MSLVVANQPISNSLASKLSATPVLAGISGAVLSSLFFGAPVASPTTVASVPIPTALLTAGVIGVSSLASEYVAKYVVPKLDPNSTIGKTAAMALQPVVTGAAVAGVDYFTGGTRSGELTKLFLLGAAAQVVGYYANGMITGPKL